MKKIADFPFVSTLYLMMDVIPHLTELSQIFQKTNLDISSVRPAIDHFKKMIQEAKTGESYHMKQLHDALIVKGNNTYLKDHILYNAGQKGQSKSKNIRESSCEQLIENLDSRFPDSSMSIATSFDMLALKGIRFMSDEDRENYGLDKIKVLTKHYDLSEKDVLRELEIFKSVVISNMYPTGLDKLYKVLKEHHVETFPNILFLMEIALIMPLHTAQVERGFSAQNIIVTSRRNRISANIVDKLMMVKCEGKNSQDFNFDAALNKWKR